ncbi:hypothetical protein G9444_1106 [Rhodococcus erythropolis]|uniref:Uncharacterized protein n=1 Tax=Rhodococcus erythropolis TaxID=1833 RepID=A0A6G9CNA5_RHOER|nr:hypothetical protein G9444_1106 [Rhodococcus erythropolis]
MWVNRVRSGAITTMKSTPVACRIFSVCGCRIAVGSGLVRAGRRRIRQGESLRYRAHLSADRVVAVSAFVDNCERGPYADDQRQQRQLQEQDLPGDAHTSAGLSFDHRAPPERNEHKLPGPPVCNKNSPRLEVIPITSQISDPKDTP